jgi:hypothetical protein
MCSASEQILPSRLPSLSSGYVVLDDDFDVQVGVLLYYVVGGLVHFHIHGLDKSRCIRINISD